jgi:hypothetical protein
MSPTRQRGFPRWRVGLMGSCTLMEQDGGTYAKHLLE